MTTTTWHITPDAAMQERVQELAKQEMRPAANMVRVLISEALFSRQLAESKQSLSSDHAALVNAIRGTERGST
jgi:CopG-like RHH_1 or ribbon-helix-helix domain, RHH_5